jgi:PAS domain S-box-containing protein
MGGAVSFINKPGSTPTTVFLSTEVIEGCRLLSCDELLAKSFVEYIKSGAWLDVIAHYIPEDLSSITDTFSYVERKLTLESPLNPSEMSSLGGSSKKSAENPGSSKSGQDSQALHQDEAYTGRVESFSSFTTDQLSSLLFAIAFPHYVASSTYRRHVKYGALAARHAEEESVCSLSMAAEAGPGTTQTPHSIRAQEMLLACAVHFDETPMLEMVRIDWVEAVSTFLATHTFAISVVDTSKIGFPFVYVNKRFETLFGYKSDDILGKPIQSLNGEKTEPSKKARLLAAFKSQLCTKLYITRYTSSGRAVQDVVAIQPVGGHAVCVHFSSAEANPMKVSTVLRLLVALVVPFLSLPWSPRIL